MMEYGNLPIIGASATQLSRFDTVKNAATAFCHEVLQNFVQIFSLQIWHYVDH